VNAAYRGEVDEPPRDSLLHNPALVERLAARERWDPFSRRKWDRLRNELADQAGVEDVFLIARPGETPIEERAVGIASWPYFQTAALHVESPLATIAAAAELLARLRA
jgi:hypothetical protein